MLNSQKLNIITGARRGLARVSRHLLAGSASAISRQTAGPHKRSIKLRFVFLCVAGGAGIFAGGLSAGTIIPLVIPAGQQGSGNWSLQVQPLNGLVRVPTSCNSTGFNGPDGCNMSAESTTGDLAAGQVLSYTDSAGIHVLTDAETEGDAQTFAMASDLFFDEITNNSGVTSKFDLTFHVDATITSDFNGASLLGINVGSESPVCVVYSDCPYEYNTVQTWNYREANDNSTSIDQAFVTDQFELGAGQSTVYVLFMSASSVADSDGQAETNAQDTLAITGFTATDMNGNPLPASDFSSLDGADYSSIDTSATPEPAALLLAGAGLIVVGFRRRRKSSES